MHIFIINNSLSMLYGCLKIFGLFQNAVFHFMSMNQYCVYNGLLVRAIEIDLAHRGFKRYSLKELNKLQISANDRVVSTSSLE